MLKKIRKNKKGILGLSDIGSFLQSIMQFITSVIPKPILFLLFLVVLLFFASLLSYAFYIGGIFCNTANEPVKLDSNILNNIALIGDIPSIQGRSTEQLATNPTDNPLIASCVEKVTTAQLTVLNSNTQQYLSLFGVAVDSTINITNATYLFKGTSCSQCLKVSVDSTGFINQHFEACYGNANRIPDTDRGWWIKQFCDSTGQETGAYCDIPAGYRYDATRQYSSAQKTLAQPQETQN
jgi:hypothetical protein